MKRLTLTIVGIVGLWFTVLPGAHAQFVFQPETSNPVFAYCFNQSGQVVHNCNVSILNGYYFTPIQHNHDNPTPPLSAIVPSAGNTGTTGLPVLINTTRVGQIEGAIVCADFCTITDYYSAYSDLVQLLEGSNWILIGATTAHPVNHLGTPAAITGIQSVAAQYRTEFPDQPVIAINDIGLPLGGIFDLNSNWNTPHGSHGRGRAADVRGNGGPNSIPRVAAIQQRFQAICTEQGATLALHEGAGGTNEHFHCQWP
jgi:hypothetical protein